ncbi:MAG: hypothetical protein Q9227_005507 [Pyrenula ochraceoflavens]
MALLIARELGLHRIDHPSNRDMSNTAQAEMGRRAWWYICASEWSIVARINGVAEGVYSCHPRHMITKKPLNINDEEIFDGMSRAERPLSHPTTMSYSLLRIRLAEISRSIVDRAPLAMAQLGGPSREDVLDIDTELQMLINDIPQFFSMSKTQLVEAYGLSPTRAADIIHQGYSFQFILHSQRCKLHLPYFTRGFVDTTYSSSREMCVKSARLIIRSHSDLENSGTGVAARFQLSGFVVGVFMASIVLLMDLCINKSSLQHQEQRSEVAEAFRMLEEAKNESETIARFVDSMTQILWKHKVPPPKVASTAKPQLERSGTQTLQASGGEIGVDTQGAHLLDSSTEGRLGTSVTGVSAPNAAMTTDPTTDSLVSNEDLASHFTELAQGLEQGYDVGEYDWNNIFSGLESSFI